MTDDIKRTRAGQFAPGQSGNAAGARSRRPKQVLELEDMDRLIVEIATAPTTLTIENKVQTVTIFERNLWVLASGKGARLPARDFVFLSRDAAARIDYRERFPRQPRQAGGVGS